MRKSLFLAFSAMAALLLMAVASCSQSEAVDASRVVINPIDLDYVFTNDVPRPSILGDISADDIDFSDPKFIEQIPAQYKNLVMSFKDHPQDLVNLVAAQKRRGSYREAADPVCIFYNDRYYLFVSHSEGYWSSPDMQHWNHVRTSVLPMDLYAPATMKLDGELYWMTSDLNSLWKTTDPENGDSWKLVTDKLMPYPEDPQRTGHDPYLFNDDGRVFLYWGCSNADFIRGVELDPKDNFKTIGNYEVLIKHNENIYGWERGGNYNDREVPGWNEGAAMFKNDGVYYLQYASPGTEFFTYGEGLYTSTSPLGPFTHYAGSPVSIKNGGWMKGAGHGDTFQDKWGNWWHVATTVISRRHDFERRIGFFPVTFTSDGGINILTSTSDLPYALPDGKVDFSKKAPWTGWMDLSIGKSASSSSEVEGHTAAMGADHDIQTWWSAESGKAGEWYCIDLGKPMRINAVQANFADEAFPYKSTGADPYVPYKYIVEVSSDGTSWNTIIDNSSNTNFNPHILSALDKAFTARYVRLTSKGDLPGKLSLYDLRVFGKGDGKAPAAPTGLAVDRSEDGRTISFKWDAVPGACGYYLRWGTNETELLTICESTSPEITLGSFSTGQKYYFTVDSFSEAGVTKGKDVLVSE